MPDSRLSLVESRAPEQHIDRVALVERKTALDALAEFAGQARSGEGRLVLLGGRAANRDAREPPRPDPARAGSARTAMRGAHQRRRRRQAGDLAEDSRPPRLVGPGQARRFQAHRGSRREAGLSYPEVGSRTERKCPACSPCTEPSITPAVTAPG